MIRKKIVNPICNLAISKKWKISYNYESAMI